MTDTPDPDDFSTEASTTSTDLAAAATSGPTYKVRGEFTDTSGAGVLGRNNAESGTPVGVAGLVPNAGGGFGLLTPHDARIEGDVDTNGTAFVVEAGTQSTGLGEARNVVLGHTSNSVEDGAIAATVSGGGFDDGSSDRSNTVYDDYGTIGGGANNQAGSDDSDELSATYPTVAGGNGNEASGSLSTVGGGSGNRATAFETTVAGGQGNEASASWASVGGGESNVAKAEHATVGGGKSHLASGKHATVGGGFDSDAVGEKSTVAGGYFNQAYGTRSVVGGGANNVTQNSDATIAGGTDNTASGGKSTVGGGGDNSASLDGSTVAGGTSNAATGLWASVGGGETNVAEGHTSTVGGGAANTATSGASNATISGGSGNRVYDEYGTVGGGASNRAGESTSGTHATVGGGRGNRATDPHATVGGGFQNIAGGAAATVPGGSNGNAANDGSFVWNDGSKYHDYDGDSNLDGLSSAQKVNGETVVGADTFSVGAQGGVRFITGSSSVTYIGPGGTGWNTSSSRAAKTDIDPVDPQSILDDVVDLEVATWRYDGGEGNPEGPRHVGPMAEEFHEVVDVGESEEHINSVDADGMLFAAVQALAQKHDEKDERIVELEAEIDRLRERLAAVEDDTEFVDGTG